MENKSYLFSLFLKYDLNEYAPYQLFLFNVIKEILHDKIDLIKCYGVKGLINASEWSDNLHEYLNSNSIYSYLCNLLNEYRSVKLTRLILKLILKLIPKNDECLIQLIDSDLQSNIFYIMSQNEDRCSSLCIEIYKHIIVYNINNNRKIDLSFLLEFQNKGFIAKAKFVEFLSWIYANKIDVYFEFNDFEKKQLFYIVDDVAHSDNEKICSCINDLYISIEDSMYGNLLLSLLAKNEDFRIFIQESENRAEFRYIEFKINKLLA